MLPCESAESGPATKVFAASIVIAEKGSMCAAECPLVLSTRKMVPPALGTYKKLLASTGGKTGSHPKREAPLVGGFQSLANVHWATSEPLPQVWTAVLHTVLS